MQDNSYNRNISSSGETILDEQRVRVRVPGAGNEKKKNITSDNRGHNPKAAEGYTFTCPF